MSPAAAPSRENSDSVNDDEKPVRRVHHAKAKHRAHHTAVAKSSPAPKKVARNASSLPQIPSQALTANADTLNRFYFLRAGDTPEKVSQFLYGSTSKADSLK